MIIEGEVKDRMGQRLSGVLVVMLPEAGGPATQTTTDRNGAYHLEGLSEETYRIDFALPGFEGFRRNRVRLDSGDGACRQRGTL
jgi:hypothetical protein